MILFCKTVANVAKLNPLYRLLQSKMTDLQKSMKGMEEKVEDMRTIKETAEQPEKEAKERHLKAWEGKCSCFPWFQDFPAHKLSLSVCGVVSYIFYNELWIRLAVIIMWIVFFLFLSDHYTRNHISCIIRYTYMHKNSSEWLKHQFQWLAFIISCSVCFWAVFPLCFLCYRTKSSDPCGEGQS